MEAKHFNLHTESMAVLAEEISKKREHQVREALKDKGHQFDTDEEFYQFLQQHCSFTYTVYDVGNVITISLDGKPFVQWEDSVNVLLDDLKITIITG